MTIVTEFTVASAPHNERQATERVAAAVSALGLPPDRLERLKTAVAETTMNAIEHGNDSDRELPVSIVVRSGQRKVTVSITDRGGGDILADSSEPDHHGNVGGLQSHRGWELYTIRNMVDEVRITSGAAHHTVDLIMNLGGDPYSGKVV
jgi:anti-sigma regulatory factor (Ser/Thr protein kinase)